MIGRLEAKGAVTYTEAGRTRRYVPAVPRNQAALEETESLLRRVYRGSVGMLVNTLADGRGLTDQDIEELSAVLDYAEARWRTIGLFAVSMGAYLSLLACRDRRIEHAWFLSPVADMVRLTRDMMSWSGISEARLEAEGAVPTAMGQTLYWDDWCYLRRHPADRWPFPTDILRGAGDTLCAEETVTDLAKRSHCRLRIVEGAGHWFHTPEELRALSDWLHETAFLR